MLVEIEKVFRFNNLICCPIFPSILFCIAWAGPRIIGDEWLPRGSL